MGNTNPKQGLQESYDSAMTTRSWCLSPQKQRIDGATLEIACSHAVDEEMHEEMQPSVRAVEVLQGSQQPLAPSS